MPIAMMSFSLSLFLFLPLPPSLPLYPFSSSFLSPFFFDTHSPQVALRIIVPKIQSPNEKVGLLALTVSTSMKLLYGLTMYAHTVHCTYADIVYLYTNIFNIQYTCTSDTKGIVNEAVYCPCMLTGSVHMPSPKNVK